MCSLVGKVARTAKLGRKEKKMKWQCSWQCGYTVIATAVGGSVIRNKDFSRPRRNVQLRPGVKPLGAELLARTDSRVSVPSQKFGALLVFRGSTLSCFLQMPKSQKLPSLVHPDPPMPADATSAATRAACAAVGVDEEGRICERKNCPNFGHVPAAVPARAREL